MKPAARRWGSAGEVGAIVETKATRISVNVEACGCVKRRLDANLGARHLIFDKEGVIPGKDPPHRHVIVVIGVERVERSPSTERKALILKEVEMDGARRVWPAGTKQLSDGLDASRRSHGQRQRTDVRSRWQVEVHTTGRRLEWVDALDGIGSRRAAL